MKGNKAVLMKFLSKQGMQYGGQKTPAQTLEELRQRAYMQAPAVADGTRVVPQQIMSIQQAEKLKAERNARELARRRAAIEASQTAASKPLLSKDRWTIENLAAETGATGDKFRFFPNDPDSFVDEYLNPFKMVGDMASSLGRAPLNISKGNYGQAAMSVAAPLVTGAMAGIGAKSAGQFVNNLANPLAGTGDIASRAVGKPSLLSDLKEGFQEINYIVDQSMGYLLNNRANKKAIAEGNQWLQNWINHPVTQSKIVDDMRPRINPNNIVKDKFDVALEQAKNFKPISAEFPISKQLKTGFYPNIDNYGVSYLHLEDPYDRLFNETGRIPFSPEVGSWISRTLKMPYQKRVGTTIHEGTHDWVSDFLLHVTRQKQFLENNLSPERLKDYIYWRDHGHEAAEKQFGRKRAYEAYLANPTEQHARLMELRKYLGHTPDFQSTPEYAQSVIERLQSLNKKDRPFDTPGFLGVIQNDPEQLSNTFNRLWGVSPLVVAGAAATTEKQYGGQQGEQRIPAQMLPFVDIVSDNSGTQYPYYYNLTEEEKRFFSSDTPIGRAVRAKAQTGKVGQTYNDLSRAAKTIEKTAAEFTGVPGTVRFSRNPSENLKGALSTIEKTIIGASPGVPQGSTPYNSKEVEGLFNTLDAVGLASMGAPLVKTGISGAKALPNIARQAGRYVTTQTPLKNAYKYNPLAFKPKEGMMYRGIGKEGMEDAIQSGVFRQKAKRPPGIPDESGVRLRGKGFGETYFSPEFSVADRYGKGFIAEVPKKSGEFKMSDSPNHASGWSQYVESPIPISEGRILQKDWLRGYKEVPKPKQLPGSSNVNSVVNTAKNLEDLKAAQQFAQQYGYELPINIERIAQSNQLTDRTIRGMMDRHNTFVRGVSTNWDELGKRNPEILRHLEGKGFDLSTKEGTQAAAEYMATHIPINTGYGRASLNNEVFDRGMEGLYTSNSIPTAEGYTYGQGYITKVKRPTNYSSSNRQDWISQNNPQYYEHNLPGDNTFMIDGKIHDPIKMDLPYLYNVKDYDNINVFKNEIIKDLEKNASNLKTQFERTATSNPEYSRNMRISYDRVIKQIEDIKAQKWETADVKFDKNLLKTEHQSQSFGTDFGGFGNTAEDVTTKLSSSVQDKVKHSENLMKLTKQVGARNNKKIAELTEEVADLMAKGDVNKLPYNEKLRLQSLEKEILDLRWDSKHEVKRLHTEYLDNNFPGWQNQKDKYAHYIHLGTPGEKVLQPIKSWEITPEIWKNKSRSHTNEYSKKFSAMSMGGMIAPPPAAIGAGTYGVNQKQDGGQHGGLDRWFAEKWVDIKTGKECGRQEGEKRAGYPACRPSKRVSEDTPKTASELSSAEKEKFKRSKTSSERISYQHRRKEFGGEWLEKYDDGGLTYNVKKGDTLSKIAAQNNTTVNKIVQANNIKDPNFIQINQKLVIPQSTASRSQEGPKEFVDWREKKKQIDDLNALPDEALITGFYRDKPDDTYLVIDKKNAQMKVYKGDKLVTAYEVGVGANPGDAQTVTKLSNGKVDWNAGNKSTGAGVYTISNIDPASKSYYGLPSFNLKNDRGIEVATTIHGTPVGRRSRFDNDNVEDNRMSYGCINGKCFDLKDLQKHVDVNTPVYILPEDKGNRFEIVDGKPVLRVSSENRNKYNTYIDNRGNLQKGQGANQSVNTLSYKPIQAVFDENKFKEKVFTWNDFNDEKELESTTKPFYNALVKHKQAVMKSAKIPSDVYNELAQMAFGIYGTESNFGDTHSAIGNLGRAAAKAFDSKRSSSPDYKAKATTYGADEENRSVGLTQMRWSYLNDDEKKVLNSLGIKSNMDFLNPEKAAIGTVALLAVRYNQQLTPEQKKDIWKYLPTKWNKRSNYADRVKQNSQFLTLKEQTNKRQTGGQTNWLENYTD